MGLVVRQGANATDLVKCNPEGQVNVRIYSLRENIYELPYEDRKNTASISNKRN